jgi:hypothetical protein
MVSKLSSVTAYFVFVAANAPRPHIEISDAASENDNHAPLSEGSIG